MTWQELKEHVNSLDEKQLSEEVQLWTDHETFFNIGVDLTNEDYYYVPEELCSVKESEVESLYKNYPENYDTPLSNLRRTHEKGFPYLYND